MTGKEFNKFERATSTNQTENAYKNIQFLIEMGKISPTFFEFKVVHELTVELMNHMSTISIIITMEAKY